MEITANSIQTVSSGSNVLFTDVAIPGNCSMLYRTGSGLVKLKGLTSTQCRARFRAYFSGNVAVPSGGTVEAISLALAIDGEAIPTTQMIVTPAAVSEYFNISSSIFIEVPACCCSTLGVKVTSGNDVLVQNANLIIERVA